VNETYSSALNNLSFCSDGQTCHGVSIVPQFFVFSYDPRSFSSSFPYLLYWFNVRNREISFYLGSAIPFPRASSVDGRPSGGVSPSILPFITLGPTLFLTSSVHSPPFRCCFGLNHFYQSSLYRLNPNPPPPLHCYITQSFSPCQAVVSNGGFAHHQFHHPPTYHAVPPRRCSSTGSPYISAPYLSEFQRFNTLISTLLCVLLVLPSHAILLSSLCSSVSARDFTKISST